MCEGVYVSRECTFSAVCIKRLKLLIACVKNIRFFFLLIDVSNIFARYFYAVANLGVLIYLQGGSRGSTPEQDREGRLGTSPHINRFLAREPPDGCEKVNLKFVEDAR